MRQFTLAESRATDLTAPVNARRGFGELSQKFGEDPSVFSFQSACGMFAKGPSRHPTAPSPRGENWGFWRLAAFSAEIVATLTAIEFFRHGPRGGRYSGFKAGACYCKRRRGQNLIVEKRVRSI